MPAIKRKRKASIPKPKKVASVKRTSKAVGKVKAKRNSKAVAKKHTPVRLLSPEKSESEEEKIVEAQTNLSNGVMVDHKVPLASTYNVVKYSNIVLNANLMFADCDHNNNKFYIIQGLKKNDSFYLWTRWGRVGVDGQNALTPWMNEANLNTQWNKKRYNKIGKGYTAVEISYEAEETKKPQKTKKGKNKNIKSKLGSEVQGLLKFIFDMKQIENSVVKVGYNVKKLPLGKLSKSTVLSGYATLKKIDDALKNKKIDKTLLSNLSSEFYRHIPHDFGFKNMSQFVIDTKEKLKDKLSLVETLNDIQITAEISNAVDESVEEINDLDAKYKKLNCKIKSLDPKSKEYQTLANSIDMKHPATSNPKVDVLDIFEIDRNGEGKKFKKQIGNRKLLWHGSTFSNWGGILSQGLRIAPPEAPACGYALGKGVYFGDVITKSAYFTRYQMSNNIGLLALCDVAVGKTSNKTSYDWNSGPRTLPKGKSSTLGCGNYMPSKEVDWNGAALQLGPLKQLNLPQNIGLNEYVVYDVDQIHMKYLFRVKFS